MGRTRVPAINRWLRRYTDTGITGYDDRVSLCHRVSRDLIAFLFPIFFDTNDGSKFRDARVWNVVSSKFEI